jgi:hypothetical protein
MLVDWIVNRLVGEEMEYWSTGMMALVFSNTPSLHDSNSALVAKSTLFAFPPSRGGITQFGLAAISTKFNGKPKEGIVSIN